MIRLTEDNENGFIDNNPYFCVADLRNILNVPQNSRLIQDLTKGFIKSEVLPDGGKQQSYFWEYQIIAITQIVISIIVIEIIVSSSSSELNIKVFIISRCNSP